jgi:hypothetical protein
MIALGIFDCRVRHAAAAIVRSARFFRKALQPQPQLGARVVGPLGNRRIKSPQVVVAVVAQLIRGEFVL